MDTKICIVVQVFFFTLSGINLHITSAIISYALNHGQIAYTTKYNVNAEQIAIIPCGLGNDK